MLYSNPKIALEFQDERRIDMMCPHKHVISRANYGKGICYNIRANR